MKTSRISVVMTVLFCATAAIADEREQLKKYFDYYVGEWEVSQEGTDQKGSLAVTNAKTGNAHVVNFTFGDVTTVAIWGYDPESKRWVGSGFAKDGSHFKSTVEIPTGRASVQPGDVIRFSETAFTDDGEQVSRWTDNIKSMNHFVMNAETSTETFSGEYSVRRKK